MKAILDWLVIILGIAVIGSVLATVLVPKTEPGVLSYIFPLIIAWAGVALIRLVHRSR